MLYHWYEIGHAAVKPARVAADSCRFFFNNPFNPLTHTSVGRSAAAACEVFERTTRRYDKPAFGLPTTKVGGATVAVHEEVVWSRPFCRLIRFRRDVADDVAERSPRVLLVAPMSGHYATLLRGTVETLLPDHDVYITDWLDARHVPMAAGSFDLDDYVSYMQDMFRFFGGDVHVFAVCQPSVPVLAATALMEEDNDPAVPLTLMLAGGPIDTRVSPTVVNDLAEKRGIGWFRRNVITEVPWPSLGHGRRVYPGFLQLSGFMSMNLDRHVKAHKDLFANLVQGDGDSAEKHREFYDEYLAVMDLTGEFFLQTIERVFIRHDLPKGTFMHRGRRVDLTAIRRVALMTIEGEKDDITGLGQCRAALDLCASVPAANKVHFEAPNVGHYGIFNGSRFRAEIAPRMARFMRVHDPRAAEAMAPLDAGDRALSVQRANGGTDPALAAFTFAAANDTAPDAGAARLRALGAAGPALGADEILQLANKVAASGHNVPQSALFQLWSYFGGLMIDGVFGTHTMMRPRTGQA